MRTPSEKTGIRGFRKAALAVVCVLLIVSAGLAVLFRDPLRTLLSFRKVDDFPLYTMRYYGDYDLERYLQGKARGNSIPFVRGGEETAGGLACTCFAALGDGENLVFGRNFDWDTQAALLLFTDPPHGYASVSMIDITYFGYGKIERPWTDRVKLLDVPYWPFDGLNERGLVVGMMAVPHTRARASDEDPRTQRTLIQTHGRTHEQRLQYSPRPAPRSQKMTVGSLEAIRLMLDYAEDVDQAISLLRQYNIIFSGGPPLHYLIADSGGDSAVVEFIDGRMSVLRSDEPWQVSTNFLISGMTPEGAKASCWRYRRAYEALEEAQGLVSQGEALAILAGVSQPSTKWSIVYGMSTGDVQVAMDRVYDEVIIFPFDLVDK